MLKERFLVQKAKEMKLEAVDAEVTAAADKQIKQAREQIGVGVIDISLADPGSGDTDAMMERIELFGQKVLPRIRDI